MHVTHRSCCPFHKAQVVARRRLVLLLLECLVESRLFLELNLPIHVFDVQILQVVLCRANKTRVKLWILEWISAKAEALAAV